MKRKNKQEIYREVAAVHGKKGGKATLQKYGTEHFQKISRAYRKRLKEEREEHRTKVDAYVEKNEQRENY